MTSNPGSEESWVETRPEWGKLGSEPVYPDCPLVLDVDTAQFVLERAVENGLVGEAEADHRIRILNLRRLVITEAQKTYGCGGICDDQDTESNETIVGMPTLPGAIPPDFICNLPVGRIEQNVAGSTMETIQSIVDTSAKPLGY